MTEATGFSETLAVLCLTTLASFQKARSQCVSVFVHKYKVVSLGRHRCIIFCNTLVLMCRFSVACLSVKSTRVQYCTLQWTVRVRFPLGRLLYTNVLCITLVFVSGERVVV
jgi:hypothetical protein